MSAERPTVTETTATFARLQDAKRRLSVARDREVPPEHQRPPISRLTEGDPR